MVKSENIFMNWAENLNIRNVSEDLPELFSQFPTAVLTCLDSTTGRDLHFVKKFEMIAQERNEQCQAISSGLQMTGVFILELTRKQYNLFNGFDEIRFFSSRPIEEMTVDIHITSEYPIADATYVQWQKDLATWMQRSGCKLALGDGIGLNYATSEASIATIIDKWAVQKMM